MCVPLCDGSLFARGMSSSGPPSTTGAQASDGVQSAGRIVSMSPGV